VRSFEEKEILAYVNMSYVLIEDVKNVRVVMTEFLEAGRAARRRSQHVAWKGKLIQYESWSQDTTSFARPESSLMEDFGPYTVHTPQLVCCEDVQNRSWTRKK
jgi:hypothetical protein